ncbi:ADP-ribosylglycohydrolase family protein [Actinophytocola algeriensis]|uniref:ADP-ribosylglycohydrolase n=1 Tax=Actinophytocola algeriensis TaxID=1768010 RepID=A0A7W7QDW5_9PSEU|nr:ADP-ribosylglycohydrolase family protein [Actinophytocola algeriensis]MBB4911797.1 ADP-ribosylglycohydrolase [Actinophytocola algeriensis]MBE1477711.1 ADP-ribosylglycohydrolase [Actinophytocola algeriensis]
MRDNAYASLVGTAVGDALGDGLYLRDNAINRRLPTAPWRWTDDTEMACSVLHVLRGHGHVDPDALATSFVAHYDVDRGYGTGIDVMMRDVQRGGDLRALATRTFGGTGSWGNGAAMRVAPLGAWFAGDPARAAAEAAVAAAVTHTHPEGIAGAVAIAVAAAAPAEHMFAEVLRHTAPGEVRSGIEKAAALRATPEEAARELGTGGRVSAPDTVPLALWVIARHPDDYEEAVWEVAALAEDVDTLCAIVGGVIAARVGQEGIPALWRQSVEPLPGWV